MGLRQTNPLHEQMRAASEIISPMLSEISHLNQEAARIAAAAHRMNVSEADRRELLLRAAAAQAALQRIERRLDGALVGQPSEIVQHGRIKDIRAAMGATRARIEQLGG
jgi:hypothetical protein